MMRWVWITLAIVVPGGGLLALVYALGVLTLRREGYRWLGVPPMYDGKEPYERWAAKMTQARATQMREDARGD